MCRGAGCNVTFSSPVLDRCTLVVTEGARVILQSPQFVDVASGEAPVAILAHGTDTYVSIKSGMVYGGAPAVAVQAGAQLEAEELVVSHPEASGVQVQGIGSHVSLDKCEFQGSPRHLSLFTHANGVYMHDGASADLVAVTVSGLRKGMVWTSGATGSMDACVVQDTLAEAVHVCERSSVNLEGCTIGRSKKAGLCAEGAGTSVAASRCEFLDNEEFGVLAASGGGLEATGCKSSGNKQAGFRARGWGTVMDLSCSSSKGDSKGCAVSDGGRVTVFDTTIQGCKHEGVSVESVGEANLKVCTIKGCTQGVTVTGGASRVYAETCTVTNTQLEGVLVVCVMPTAPHATYARAVLRDCLLSHSAEASGVATMGEYSDVEVYHCKLAKNRQCGALGTQGAKLHAYGCSSQGNKEAGFCAQNRANVTVDSCSSVGDKEGVSVTAGGKLHMDCLLYTSPSPRDRTRSRMPSSA